MKIHEYARLNPKEKEEMIKNYALFLENYRDKESIVCVYYLNGFFVEVVTINNRIIDILPYKRGYSTIKNSICPLQNKNGGYCIAA
jgi:hypothetical protein